MVFISKVVPRYRKWLLESAGVKTISYGTIGDQEWLGEGSLNIKGLFKSFINHKNILVGDYNSVSFIMVLLGRIFGKSVYIVSDWCQLQELRSITMLRHRFLEFLSSGFVQGTPVAKPKSSKTPIVAFLYLSPESVSAIRGERDIDFLFVGQFIERKKIHNVISVFRCLSELGYRCVMVGNYEVLAKTTILRILDKDIELVGPIQMGDWTYFSRAKVLYAPADEDVWGMTTIEALSNAVIPVSCNKVGSFVYYKSFLSKLDGYDVSEYIMNIDAVTKTLIAAADNYYVDIIHLEKEFLDIEPILIKNSINSLVYM